MLTCFNELPAFFCSEGAIVKSKIACASGFRNMWRHSGSALLLASFLGIFSGSSVQAATCLGNCGTSVATDGVVTIPVGFSSVSWISTSGGTDGAGQLSGVGGTNGTSFTSTTFSATAGQTLQYYFNYITSDGSGFPDYAWVQLQTSVGNPVALLLTAQTQPSGSIIPAPLLPPTSPGVTLTPSSVPIIPGGPAWSPLGSSSGSCWAAGCGYTDWVKSEFTIGADGDYQLLLGVTNVGDLAFDSGLAFTGLAVCTDENCNPIEEPSATPLPAALPLFATGLGALGLLGWRRKRKQAA